MFSATTRGIRVDVESEYIPEQSDPTNQRYFFAYHIKITNEGTETVQLVTRHWVITNADGHVEEVQGEGVVGEQPTLSPGETFEYTSFCPLNTPLGTMHGTYQMVTDDGEEFDAEVPVFTLAQEKIVFH